MFFRLFVLLFTFIVSGCGSTSVDMENISTISGIMAYKQRIALPPSAEVIVTLEDVSRVGGSAMVIGESRFYTQGKQVPLEFSINYSTDHIKSNHSYVVRAKIKQADELIYTTDTAYRVITDPKQTDYIEMNLVAVVK